MSEDQKSCMLYVKGVSDKAYRCSDCGANVFTRLDDRTPRVYRCNGCGAEYVEAAGSA